MKNLHNYALAIGLGFLVAKIAIVFFLLWLAYLLVSWVVTK